MSELIDLPKDFESRRSKEPLYVITFSPKRIPKDQLVSLFGEFPDELIEEISKSPNETYTLSSYTLPCTINGVPGAGCQICVPELGRCFGCHPPPCI